MGARVVAVDRPLGGDAPHRGRDLGVGCFRDRYLRGGRCREEPYRPRGAVGCRVAGMRNPLGGRHILGAGTSAGCVRRVGAVGWHRHRPVGPRGDRVADRRTRRAPRWWWVSMTCICSMTCRRSLCIRSCSGPPRKWCSRCVTVNRFPPGYRNCGRPASSTGSICSRCRPTRPPRCCRPLWADRWIRTPPAASGS